MTRGVGIVKTLLIILVLVILNVLIIENYSTLSEPLSLKADVLIVRWESARFSVGTYLFFSFLVGFALAGLLGIVTRVRLGARMRDLERRIREMGKILPTHREGPHTHGRTEPPGDEPD